MKREDIKTIVKEAYGKFAEHRRSCCAPAPSCCDRADVPQQVDKTVGYSEEELRTVPEGADLGLGCGNPVAVASLREGETVLDLGSGAGIDVFLAAGQVGKNGTVIGVDMTPAMVMRARENSTRGDYGNVEFRLGEIEDLPVADNTVDVVISNCVINLSPDKPQVFREAFRVLRPGGRLMISDIVLLRDLPDPVKHSVAAYTGCVAGAMLKEEYLAAIRVAGFENVRILQEMSFPLDDIANDPIIKSIIEDAKLAPEDIGEAAKSVVSVRISGLKPGA